MHLALQIPDILSCVLKHCDTASVARVAAVCRAWSDTSNNVLWKNVTCLWTLVQLLGPMHFYGGEMVFTRAFAVKNWDRFLLHARRVQDIDYDTVNAGHRELAPETFTILGATRPILDFVPNLRRLFWHIDTEIHFAHAMLFLSAHVETLHLVLNPSISPDTMRDFLADLPRLCPRVTKLHLDFDTSMSSLEPVFSTMLAALTSLEEVVLPAFCITSGVLRALSTHRKLRKVSARPFWGARFLGSGDDVKAIDVSDLSADCFPHLKDLELDGAFTVVEKVLAGPYIPNTLTRLFISTFEKEPLENFRHFLSFVASEFTELTFLGFTYLVRPGEPADADAGNTNTPISPLPRVSFDILRPALALRKLKTFLFMYNQPLSLTDANIAEMGAAWGTSPLKHLRLVPDPLFSSTPPLETTHTLATLSTFAHHLPRLEHLELFIDAGAPHLPSLPPADTFPALHTLDIGISPIADAEHGRVARWLAQLVPRKMTLAYQPGWTMAWARVTGDVDSEALAPRRGAWQRVGDMHAQLCIAAKENSDRVRKLEEEVAAKDAQIKALEDEMNALRLLLADNPVAAQGANAD